MLRNSLFFQTENCKNISINSQIITRKFYLYERTVGVFTKKFYWLFPWLHANIQQNIGYSKVAQSDSCKKSVSLGFYDQFCNLNVHYVLHCRKRCVILQVSSFQWKSNHHSCWKFFARIQCEIYTHTCSVANFETLIYIEKYNYHHFRESLYTRYSSYVHLASLQVGMFRISRIIII